MRVPLEIRFHNMDPSDAIEAAVRKRAATLERFVDNIISCRVAVEAPHKHHRQGRIYRVSVDVRVPGGEVVASRDPAQDHSHEDLYVALRDAFNAARRQLQDHLRVQRGKVKANEGPPHGRIVSVDLERQCGRLATLDGRDIFFHRNSVINADLEDLAPGVEVRFSEEVGDKGPQASTVHVVGKQNTAGLKA